MDPLCDPVIRHYLRRLEGALPKAPKAAREELLREVVSHIADGLRHGYPPRQLLGELGPPEVIAAQLAADLKPVRDAARLRAVLALLPTLLILTAHVLANPQFAYNPYTVDYVLIRWISTTVLVAGSVILWRKKRRGLASLWALYAAGTAFLLGGVVTPLLDMIYQAAVAIARFPVPALAWHPAEILSILLWSIAFGFLVIKRPGNAMFIRENLAFVPWVGLPAAFFLVWCLVEATQTTIAGYVLRPTGIALLITQMDAVGGQRFWRLGAGVTIFQLGVGVIASFVDTNTLLNWSRQGPITEMQSLPIPGFSLIATPVLLLAMWRCGAALSTLWPSIRPHLLNLPHMLKQLRKRPN